jgi:hypothetical protein
MSPERRRYARFYLRLATSPDLRTLPRKQQEALLREARLMFMPPSSLIHDSQHHFPRMLWEACVKAQPWLATALPQLVREDRAEGPRFDPPKNPPLLFCDAHGRVTDDPVIYADEFILNRAVHFLKADVVPYKECAQCHALFVADTNNRKKKFCSAPCRRKSQSSTPARKEYMRQWVANYRKKLQEQRIPHHQPHPSRAA